MVRDGVQQSGPTLRTGNARDFTQDPVELVSDEFLAYCVVRKDVEHCLEHGRMPAAV